MRKPLKTFHVYFSAPCGCVTIKAASMKEAKIIAQDNYDRGELTEESRGFRPLPEGRSIEAIFYDHDNSPLFISDIEEDTCQ